MERNNDAGWSSDKGERMEEYVFPLRNGAVITGRFLTDRDAVAYARRYNESHASASEITDVLKGGRTVLGRGYRSNMKRIGQLLAANGLVLQRTEQHYLVESTDRRIKKMLPKLRKYVKEDIDGYVVFVEDCIDYRERRYLYRILFG